MDDVYLKVQVLSDQCSALETRIDKLETEQKELSQLNVAMHELTIDQRHMKDDINEIKKCVKVLSDIPSQRWNAMIEKAIAVLLGAFLAYLFSVLGG